MKALLCTITAGCASGLLYMGLTIPAEQPYCFAMAFFAGIVTICIAIIDI